MNRDEDFKLLKIQTIVLKVNIHCEGCKKKVTKLLQKIEGVYKVNVETENQKATVSGNVDCETLIKRLARAGKHAELWSQRSNNQKNRINQQKQNNLPETNKNQNKQKAMKDQQAFQNQFRSPFQNQPKSPFQNQLKSPFYSSSDEDDFSGDDDEDDEEDDLPFLRNKINQINLLKPTNNTNSGNISSNISPWSKGGGKGGKSNQNSLLMSSNGMLDQSGTNFGTANNKLMGGRNFCLDDGKRVGDINAINVMGSNQVQPHFQPNNIQTPIGFPSNGFGVHQFQHQQQPHSNPKMLMNMQQGYQSHHPSTMMNINRQNNMQNSMQPQMVYNRAPQVPSYTGYYHPYYTNPYVYHYQTYGGGGEHDPYYPSSDDNANSCSIM